MHKLLSTPSATCQIFSLPAWGPHNYRHTTILYSVRNILTISFSLLQPLSVLPLGAVIAVAAVGAVLLLAVLVALLVCGWCCLRRRRRYEYSTGEYRVTVQTWNATNPIHYTVSKSGSFSSRMSSIRSSFGLKPKVLSNSYKERQDHLYRNATTDIYSTPLWCTMHCFYFLCNLNFPPTLCNNLVGQQLSLFRRINDKIKYFWNSIKLPGTGTVWWQKDCSVTLSPKE